MLDIAATAVAFAIAILVVWRFPTWSGLRARLAGLDVRVDAYLKIGARLGLRQTRLGSEVADVASERARLEFEKANLEAELRTAQALNEAVLRILDDEHVPPGASLWLFLIANKKQDALTIRGGGSYFFDGSWTRPQAVLVPAVNLDRARSQAEQRFPPALGFTIVKSDMAPPHLTRLAGPTAVGEALV
ncbi:hypothetical protein [Arenibaculum pallidiluteum]|uniref:hypothetical protein n=1 Tax=Arenibaculum pallidiluteum TaxID=2812559 RepID=UPI001A9713C5|nr:hypothetical protein [Arenibaculum pallidiluteum]